VLRKKPVTSKKGKSKEEAKSLRQTVEQKKGRRTQSDDKPAEKSGGEHKSRGHGRKRKGGVGSFVKPGEKNKK